MKRIWRVAESLRLSLSVNNTLSGRMLSIYHFCQIFANPSESFVLLLAETNARILA